MEKVEDYGGGGGGGGIKCSNCMEHFATEVKWEKLRNIYAICAKRVAIIPMDCEIIRKLNMQTTFINARKQIVIAFLRQMLQRLFIKKAAIKAVPRVQCALSSPPQTTECDALPTLALMLRSDNAVTHYEVVGSFLAVKYVDSKVQRAAIGALQTLAFKNDENKIQIVSCNALPTLVLMLRSEDAAIHYEAVGEIGNLVHSSPSVKKEVLNAGVLQPDIGLLSSCCTESQRETALLLGKFAATDSDCKRGAVRSLIDILQSPDVQLMEMAAFALGRLAQDTHNQAGIVYDGGLMPLLKLLESKHGPLQHNAAFALYGLADNEDNVSDFIKVGGVPKLQDGEFIVQATKDCVARTLKRLEEKIKGRLLNHLIYLMRVGEKVVQRRVALALAHLCSPCDQKTVFIDNKGLELLLGLLASSSTKQQKDASVALCKLATKATLHSTMDSAPLSPTHQVYLGIEFVNNATLSNVTFVIEGKQFHAHKITLLASSDAFRAMFDGGYRERDAKDIEIPNIKWEIFELMMRYIYTGLVDITLDVAKDLLRAADQYLLDGLKHLCECAIAKDISLENIASMYELSEAFHDMTLRNSCIMFILEHLDKLVRRVGYVHTIQRVLTAIQCYFSTSLAKPANNSQ